MFELLMPKNDNVVSVVGYVDAEQKYMPENGTAEVSLLSSVGRGYFIVAVFGDDEPSNHALRELEATLPVFEEWGRPIVVLSQNQRNLEACKQSVSKYGNALFYGTDTDAKVEEMFHAACNGGKGKLPVVAIADSFGRVVYYSQGYNTSINAQITDVIYKISH